MARVLEVTDKSVKMKLTRKEALAVYKVLGRHSSTPEENTFKVYLALDEIFYSGR